MTELLEELARLNAVLTQNAPNIASRFQPGLTHSEISAQVDSSLQKVPQDVFDLYQSYNGLSGQPGKLNLFEKLLRLKGKWHGELSGRENEVHLKIGNCLLVVKFLPLDYALAGNRHLRLGQCSVDLLPIAILTDGKETIYCMMHLNLEKPTIYCAKGTNLPPMKITESFLSTQPQFRRLSELITLLTTVFQRETYRIAISQEKIENQIDCELDLMQFEKLYQQCSR
jgi:hypothetical protein